MTEEQETNRRVISLDAMSYIQKRQEAAIKFNHFDKKYREQILALGEELSPYFYNTESYFSGPWGNNISWDYELSGNDNEQIITIKWDCYGSGDSDKGEFEFPLEFLWNPESVMLFKTLKKTEFEAVKTAKKNKERAEKQATLERLKKELEQ